MHTFACVRANKAKWQQQQKPEKNIERKSNEKNNCKR